MTTERHRITHKRLTSILGREPWALPDPDRVPEGPRASELLKTMSQRAAAEHLGISRRQLSKMVEAEGQALDDDNPFSEGPKGSPTMTRAGAVASLQALSERPQGATKADLYEHVVGVFGCNEDGTAKATPRQVRALRESVQAKGTGALFAPDYLDPMRAESQRRAMVATVTDLQDRLTEALTELAAGFPGGSYGAMRREVLALLVPELTQIPAESRLENMSRTAEAFKDRNGDAGTVETLGQGEPVDPEWSALMP